MRSPRMDELAPNRRLTVRLLRAGMITVPEAARQLRVSRQLVHYWMRNSDLAVARERRVMLMYETLIDTPWGLADHSRDVPGFQDLTVEPWPPVDD